MIRPFHLAFLVRDLDETRVFYRDILGCGVGRSAETWIDFDFFGHQLSCHLGHVGGDRGSNAVDGDKVPIPHFGVVLAWDDWQTLSQRLTEAGIDFVIPPRIRFAGQPGEQGTLFFRDPSGNALEFKSFRSDDSLFAQ